MHRDAPSNPSEAKVMSAGTLIGDKVRNTQGEDLGKIEEIMLDTDRGEVAYAVLSFGGVMGMGDKLFAIPWTKLAVNTRDHEMVLDVPKEKLEDAPGFDKNHWPDFADPTWNREVHDYYGSTYAR